MSSELVVAKFGSNILVSDDFDTQERLNTYANSLLARHAPEDLVVVSSGAVALGAGLIRNMERDPDQFTLQQKAQVGGTAIAEAWKHAFKEQGVLAGGLFVTHHELDTNEGSMLRANLEDNRRMGIVSVLNENDALSDTELMKLITGGDNDGLARHVGQFIGANRLYLYTRGGGIRDEDGQHIPVVDKTNLQAVTAMLQARVINPRSAGRGGIVSKNKEAVEFARTSGIAMIAPPPNGHSDDTNVTKYQLSA